MIISVLKLAKEIWGPPFGIQCTNALGSSNHMVQCDSDVQGKPCTLITKISKIKQHLIVKQKLMQVALFSFPFFPQREKNPSKVLKDQRR